ncbi:MAG: hypothetical protein P1U74_04310 [Legionellaceae bacterium]|nr:hypothetical protein [Legionellaceae bacterium]
MKQSELVQLYPWTNNQYVKAYSEKFTDEQWREINTSEIPRLISSKKIDDMFIASLFESILMMINHPDLQTMLRSGDLTFSDIIAQQLQLIESTVSQQSLGNPSLVMSWLGPLLCKKIETEVSSYDEMDNLVQLLSSENIRDLMSGNSTAISKLSSIPPILANLQGQDARELLNNTQMTFKQFMGLAKELSNPIERDFPNWVEDNIELKKLANHFSDTQLKSLGKLMVRGIVLDRELKCSFLRLVLLQTTIKGEQLIKKCPDDAFRRLILTNQDNFLQTIHKKSAEMNEGIASAFEDVDTLSQSTNSSNVYHSLIRKYISEYSSPHTPIPTDLTERQKVFAATLRNSIHHGNFWDFITLVKVVDNINSKGLKSGKTALHVAAEYTTRTGNQIIYDILMNTAGIDPSITDNSGKTARDYLKDSNTLDQKEECRIM